MENLVRAHRHIHNWCDYIPVELANKISTVEGEARESVIEKTNIRWRSTESTGDPSAKAIEK
jgi:hypothetical protein